jgi:hypothetical protein
MEAPVGRHSIQGWGTEAEASRAPRGSGCPLPLRSPGKGSRAHIPANGRGPSIRSAHEMTALARKYEPFKTTAEFDGAANIPEWTS